MSNDFQRDDEEIVRYYEKIQPHDHFGIWGTELLLRVPLAKAERMMQKDHGWTEETWARAQKKKDFESVLADMEDFFQFATERAVAHRGLTASQSIVKYMAWSWLINDMELFAYLMNGKNYPNYGCPMLLAVAQKHDMMDLMPMNPVDYQVFMRMSRGQICGSLCNGGCGHGQPVQFRPLDILLPPNGQVQNRIVM